MDQNPKTPKPQNPMGAFVDKNVVRFCFIEIYYGQLDIWPHRQQGFRGSSRIEKWQLTKKRRWNLEAKHEL